MENKVTMGMNRTGMQVSPALMGKMKEVTELTVPSSDGDEAQMAAIRSQYIEAADPVGSMPPPASAKGAAKAAMKMMAGKRPQLFLDKLGERLAFERTGSRLYEALITKCAARDEGAEAIPAGKLREIQREEARHFALLAECIRKLGGDPTAQTPCADVAGVESMGLMQVVTDPKTTVNQSLHAILVAELADNAGWEELVVLASEMGQEDMVAQFEEAAAREAEHLEHVKRWHQEAMLQELKLLH